MLRTVRLACSCECNRGVCTVCVVREVPSGCRNDQFECWESKKCIPM